MAKLPPEIQSDNLRTGIKEWLEMVERFRDSAGWSPDELPIEMIQTHISVLLVGKRHVLKLKKPVNFGFLDYTTLEKRRRACESEVSLNRRLCPGVYLGVRPIADVSGQPRLTGAGNIIDYGVLMKRLPADRMLDRMVAEGTVTESMIDRVAKRLSDFHQEARRGPDIDAYGSPEMIRANWDENFTQTAPYVGRTITGSAFDSIRTWVSEWLEGNHELLGARVRDGRVCDGHGDVRSESICMTEPVSIFDCIEFNERFRYGDVASEVAFLEMDLHARGRPDLGYYFSERYLAHAGADPQLLKLLPFYCCYRAFVRGKVLSFRLSEPGFSEAEQEDAQLRAKSYFELARRYAFRLKGPTVIAVAGLSGTGKTSLARAIADELGLPVRSADAIRKTLFENTGRAGYGEGPYGAEANRRTYQTLLGTGRALLKEYGGVILDATFRRAADRAMARRMAMASGARWRLIRCKLAPDVVHHRLEQRAARGEGLSDATWDTYLRQREELETAGSPSDASALTLDTNWGLSATSHRAADWLRENEGDQ